MPSQYLDTYNIRADIHPRHIHHRVIPLNRHIGNHVDAIVRESLHAFIMTLSRVDIVHADGVVRAQLVQHGRINRALGRVGISQHIDGSVARGDSGVNDACNRPVNAEVWRGRSRELTFDLEPNASAQEAIARDRDDWESHRQWCRDEQRELVRGDAEMVIGNYLGPWKMNDIQSLASSWPSSFLGPYSTF